MTMEGGPRGGPPSSSLDHDRGAEAQVPAQPRERLSGDAQAAGRGGRADRAWFVGAVDGELVAAAPADGQVGLVAGQAEGEPAERPRGISGGDQVGDVE